MPKVKRFRNSLKSVHASHGINENSSSSTSTAQSNAIGPSTSAQSFPHDASNSLPFDEVEQEQAPIQPSNSRATSQSTSNWRVETIDLEKNIKTSKLKVHDVNNLPLGECIIVDFDEYGAAIGAADELLAGYCGTLAIDCNLFPIGFDKWRGPAGVPENYKKDCFETILKFLETGENPSRGKMFLETHKKKDGSFVNEETRIIEEQIELNVAQSNESEASPNDIIGKLFGAEHSGRVRCLGMGTVPSNVFKNAKQRLSNLSVPSSDHGASSSTNTYLHQKATRLEYQLEGTLNALKDYMISKEESIPVEFTNLFAPQS